MELEKYSFGIGDRFGKEGRAQLRAIQQLSETGLAIVPVWNKSFREHQLVGSKQAHVKWEAEDAVMYNQWAGNYYVDADHINLSNVEDFLEHSNFFTIDVADKIGQAADASVQQEFISRNKNLIGQQPVASCELRVSYEHLEWFAGNYLSAIQEVKKIYEYITARRGGKSFVPEVSMDEVATPQSPLDILFILKELKHLGVDLQTIAPKFTGLFPKGVDYEGDTQQFAKEFEEDVLILKYAIENWGLPENLKLSIHSGSDKFSIYTHIKEIIARHDVGIHVKTAGTTWLEEIVGLARGGLAGLAIAKHVYREAMNRYEELTAPYASVLHLDHGQLPSVADVLSWKSERFVKTLVHDQSVREYNPHFRQLIHVAYKVAAEMGQEFLDALEYYREPVEEQVYVNLLERHLKRLF